MGYSPGIIIEILEEIGSSLNLTYDYIFESSLWSGFMDDSIEQILASKNVDIIADGAVTEKNEGLFSSSTSPFMFQYTGMMIRSPDRYNEDTWLIITEPFGWHVWLLIIISIFVSGFWIVITTFILSKVHDDIRYNYLDGIWIFYSAFLSQGLHRQPTSHSSRLTIAAWWLASITLSASFTGSLVALFAVERESLPFNSLQDMVHLVKNGKYMILMSEKAKWQADLLSTSTLSMYKALWHEMYNNKKLIYVDSEEIGIDIVKKSPGYILFGSYETLSTYATVECEIVMLQETILPVYLSIPMRKDSKYLPYFSSKIKQFMEFGLVNKWLNDYKAYILSRRKNRCKKYSTKYPSQGFLSLSKMQGAFWILLCGLAFSTIIIIIEKMYKVIMIYRSKGGGDESTFQMHSTRRTRSNNSTIFSPIEEQRF